MNRQRTRGRRIDGILPLDKPAGVTSNGILQRVKHLYQARKAGHTGSLDQMATGMLPICFGEATKMSGFLLDADKLYQATCKLGVTTNTGDAMGETVRERPVPDLDRDRVIAVLGAFTGTIEQVPPMHSALKHKGRRLYELVREGIEVERQPRPVTIFRLELLALRSDEIDIEVHCSKGTYIRTLAEDIGERLDCGAHVSALRRLGVGPFTADQMLDVDQIEQTYHAGGLEALDRLLLPLDSAVDNRPAVELAENVAYYLRQGQPVMVPNAPTEGWLRLYDHHRRFLGMGEILDDGRVAPRRLVRCA